MSEPSFWAIVPAAGVGSRMGSKVPKQYLPLAGRTVIDHTIERILLHPRIDGLYVALSDEDVWWQDTVFADHPDLVRVSGGVERCHSVMHALKALSGRADRSDWVLVHDAARPCVRREDIDHLIDMLQSHETGGLLGRPVHDTMKRTDSADRVIETVERNHLWHAFTPQMFRFGVLLDSLGAALDAGFLVTDEASAVEWRGHRPIMVEGHADNLKITRPEDLPLAAYHISQQLGDGFD
ncbi:MAG: 2-C-methyl-D-erythritol 4-phosphate cytidylyltransferase [Gammaproteobacteria bacterium]|nr:2-C-methyl-D-erythritol 4-phosphate cytidylyltransferase [Gammaproteobacteria bacterium]